MKTKKKLGALLLDIGLITQDDLKRCLDIQRTSNLKLGEIILKENLASREQLSAILEYQYGVPFVELSNFNIDPAAPKIISESMARKHQTIPVAFEGNQLVVVMADPFDLMAKDDIQLITGYQLKILMSFSADIEKLIDQYYDASEVVNSAFVEMEEQHMEEDFDAIGADIENDEVANSPVVRVVNSIIRRAIKTRTSDIHIEPFEETVRVRFRVDGDLKVEMSPPKNSYQAIVTRIKILGGMDIAEKRIPQDGRIETEVDGKAVDMRVSILPTVFGEKIVIRILDRSSIQMTKEKIGFSPKNIELFDKIIKAPEGIILLTGPTGSGKTTTLYAVLRELNQVKTNIITAEDPVEYKLDGINQVQINAKAGMTFAAALRSMLRQDPDVIMVGEMRDTETAEIAIRAAITGHLVLSTLHTNDTVSTISRLIDMGIEPFMVSTSVVGIIAQRLVKRICDKCKVKVAATEEEKKLLNNPKLTHLYKGKGCNSCSGSGYKGRIGIHEILVLDRDLKSAITKGKTVDELRVIATKSGLKTLTDSSRELVLKGVTTVEEMLRVAFSVED